MQTSLQTKYYSFCHTNNIKISENDIIMILLCTDTRNYMATAWEQMMHEKQIHIRSVTKHKEIKQAAADTNQ